MRIDLTNAKNQIANQKPQLEQNVQDMLEKNMGGDKKQDKDDYDSIAKPFIEMNELKLLDPCEVESKIETLDEKIDNFLAEVDFVLSESNSRTEIEV